MLKNVRVLKNIIGALLKYAPIIIVICKALQMVQGELGKIETGESDEHAKNLGV